MSGVLLLGRGRRGAGQLSAELRAGRLRKEYVARVRGVFPPGERHVHAPIGGLALALTLALALALLDPRA